MRHARRILPNAQAVALLALLGCVGLQGCKGEADPAAPAPPSVDVRPVVVRKVTEFDDYTGRFVAVEKVEVRPRVDGYISRVRFEEGKDVKRGEVLFEIDPRPYETALKRAQADLQRARTQLALAKTERGRAEGLLAARAISQEEFDTRASALDQAGATVAAAQAAVDAAALDLSFTRVEAPIAGVASRAEFTTGNLVQSGVSVLTTVVSIDPIYVEFEGDEQAYLKYSKLAASGERASSRTAPNPIWVGLANETDFPHQGEMVFVDNEINPQTGTIRARGMLANLDRRFTPGLFARVRLVGSGEYEAVMVPDTAIGTDQGRRYVLVVENGDTAAYRSVTLGSMIDGMRVIRDGLKPGDVIVTNGLQRVRPGSKITPRSAEQNASAQ